MTKEKISPEEIFERVSRLLVEVLGVKKEEIKPESSIDNDLNADNSLRYEILLGIEQEFDRAFEDEKFEKIQTVQDLVNLIQEKLEEK
jgi:acyl carrier protein